MLCHQILSSPIAAIIAKSRCSIRPAPIHENAYLRHPALSVIEYVMSACSDDHSTPLYSLGVSHSLTEPDRSLFHRLEIAFVVDTSAHYWHNRANCTCAVRRCTLFFTDLPHWMLIRDRFASLDHSLTRSSSVSGAVASLLNTTCGLFTNSSQIFAATNSTRYLSYSKLNFQLHGYCTHLSHVRNPILLAFWVDFNAAPIHSKQLLDFSALAARGMAANCSPNEDIAQELEKYAIRDRDRFETRA